jgi:hypothetical protein
LKPELTIQQLINIEKSFSQQLLKTYIAVGVEYKRAFPEQSPDESGRPYYMAAARFQVTLEQWWGAKAAAPTAAQVKGLDEEAEVLLGLGQTILWPLLLAFALALRITKVTVDVFEWAK